MTLQARADKAFKALEEIGAPVLHKGSGWGGNALFAISAEMNDDVLWADYYQYQHVHSSIEDILDLYGLSYEWQNAGVLDVWEM